jgi:Tol biopolymer transport system component
VPYNGHVWFLNTANLSPLEYYPDGVARAEVFAFRDDYDYYNNDNSTTKVQLTNDITLQSSGDGLYAVHWVPGGQKISFRARRWSGSTIVEGGIYTASLQFGPDGNITGLAAQPVAPAIPFSLDSTQWPNVRTYGWDPTGSKIAYDDSATLGVADVVGSPHQIIYNGYSHTPQWSPDGSKIAFTNANVGISTINPNGTSLKEIVRRTSAWTFDRPFWSPTGSHIVCYGFAATGPINDDIFRATSNGNSLTNLTNTSSDSEYPMGWR